MENRKFVLKQSDSLFVATKIDPKDTFLVTFSFLGPSCPFVVLCEHKELLVERFTKLPAQKLQLLSLSDAWMREFQVLPGQTHPNMNMGHYGWFILAGIKICPKHGINEWTRKKKRGLEWRSVEEEAKK